MLRGDARKPPCRAPEGAAGGPERAPARGRDPRRGTAADPRRRGQRQDARARPPDRVPRLHRPGAGGRDPRDHVHEQGRQGDARPRRAIARTRHARDVADDLPRRLRADPARRGRAPGLHAPVHDLRPGRRAPADQALHRRARDRPQALHPRRPAQPDLGGEEQAARRRDLPAGGRLTVRGDGRRGLQAVRARPAALERDGLRRPAVPDREPAGAVRPGPRALRGDVPARARRRVPGHQPRAVPVPAAAGGWGSSAAKWRAQRRGAADEPSRRTESVPPTPARSGTATWRSSATTRSRSTASEEPMCATSSTSRRTSPTRGW